MNHKNSWTLYSEQELAELESMSKEYIAFMSKNKTEREWTASICDWAGKNGFLTLEEVIHENKKLNPGDKVLASHMGKTVVLFIMGRESMTKGINYAGAHIDSPRLDLKQHPLYEDHHMVYMDTRYYGGIKKYQWVTIPLAIHGVVCLKDGSVINVVVGEDPSDPVLCITDLLIHLSQEQMTKGASKVIEGEDLDLLVGSRPVKDEDEKNPAKAYILKLISEKYGMEEEDFISSELEVVPAGMAREAGLDRSMIMAYGQDDKSCAFSELYAIQKLLKEMEKGYIPERTLVAVFTDKEEVGSIGATGSHSHFFENTIAEICNLDPGCAGIPLELCIRRCLQNSIVMSADVSSAYDPLYASAFSKNNTAVIGEGIAMVKYTGGRGKSGSNDANAEYLAAIRRIMDEHKVNYQTAEIGKVDLGGGGTIAYIVAAYGGSVVDCGIPVLSMHAPNELISKADLYEAYKFFAAFYRYMK